MNLALDEPNLSPRELAVRFTDTERYFVSEASVYRMLKAHDLITSPAFIVIKAADEFKDKTTAPNQLWQTDFTYLKVIGWGWFYLSTVLDDFSRYIVAWKLCTTMKAGDVTDTLTLALQASGLDSMNVVHRPRLLSDNGSSYIAGDLADWLDDKGMDHVRGAPLHPQTQGKIERWHQTLKNRILLENYYLPGDLEAEDRRLRRPLQPSAIPREHRQPDPGRRLLRARSNHPAGTRKDQTTTPSKTDACNIAARPHNINQQMRQILSSITPPTVSNYLTTDTEVLFADNRKNFDGFRSFEERQRIRDRPGRPGASVPGNQHMLRKASRMIVRDDQNWAPAFEQATFDETRIRHQ